MDTQAKGLKLRVGHAMQSQRERLGWTQKVVAERAQVSLKYYGEVERGEANVTLETLGRIAVLLEWNPWSLFGDARPQVSESVYSVLVGALGDAENQLKQLRVWFQTLAPPNRESSGDGAVGEPVETKPVDHSIAMTPRGRRRGRPPGSRDRRKRATPVRRRPPVDGLFSASDHTAHPLDAESMTERESPLMDDTSQRTGDPA